MASSFSTGQRSSGVRLPCSTPALTPQLFNLGVNSIRKGTICSIYLSNPNTETRDWHATKVTSYSKCSWLACCWQCEGGQIQEFQGTWARPVTSGPTLMWRITNRILSFRRRCGGRMLNRMAVDNWPWKFCEWLWFWTGNGESDRPELESQFYLDDLGGQLIQSICARVFSYAKWWTLILKHLRMK